MTALSLFSGIGGLDIAAHAAGIETVGFCEIEPFAVKVLERRWPGVPIIDDVRKIRGCDWAVDVVHGGFPCQDLSVAGKQAGLEGARSGLWFEMLRVISEIRPAFVVAENVRGAVNLALDAVQAGMEDEGYKVWAFVLPAAAFGAPHKRERLFVIGVRSDVAYGACKRLQRMRTAREQESESEVHAGETIPLCDSIGSGELWPTPTSTERSGINPHTGRGGGLSNAVSLWPTPHRNCSNGAGAHGDGGLNIQTAVSLWRTPDANCMRGPSSEERMAWKREKGMPMSINDQVAEAERGSLWPTPSASSATIQDMEQAKFSGNDSNRPKYSDVKSSGSLNPAWVEILMGFPLGWTDLDCDEPEPWPGWPALMGERLWGTHTATFSVRSSKFIRDAVSPAEFVAGNMVADQYPYEPPRTVTGCPNRAKRLKCLGNAVVPAQARPFFEAMASIYSRPSYSGKPGNVPRETLRKGME